MRIFAIFALLCAALPARADDSITTFTLDNGMEAVVIQDTRAPVAVHMVWYRVGSADEVAGKSGIAHFLEHLMFKGTETIEPGEFSARVKAQGGSDNAFTSFDYTGYFQRIASDRLDMVMALEADRMRNLVLDDEDMLTELDVVLEERAQRTDSSPGALLNEQRMAALYLNHPYGRPIIGWRHEIEELTLQDALDFYALHYAPNNAILVVAGDVDPAEVKAMAETHYGPIAPSPTLQDRDRVDEPPQIAARRVALIDERVSNPYVLRTYLAPERDAGDQRTAAALTLFARLLGGSSATSHMGQMLEQDEKVAVYTAAFYDGMSLDDTTFGLLVIPVPGRTLEQAEADMDRAIETFFETGIDSDKLDRLKAQVRASQIYSRDSLQGRARLYGQALTSGLTVQDVQDWPDIMASITEEEILEAGRAVLNLNASVTATLARPATEEAAQ